MNMNEEVKEVEVSETATKETETSNENDTMTISKADYNKAIQSETDKVRTKYSKQVKELETRIKELEAKKEEKKVPEKTEKEIELEAREKALLARENAIAMNEKLSSKGMKVELANYLKDGVDVDQLSSVIDSMVSERMTAKGYVPSSHKTGKGMTKEDFYKMDMDAQEKFFRENPESFHALFN